MKEFPRTAFKNGLKWFNSLWCKLEDIQFALRLNLIIRFKNLFKEGKCAFAERHCL